MSALASLRALTPQQRNTVIASYLGWTLDAFDFFILVFVLKYIAEEFHTDVPAVSVAIFLTLAMRALGALIFGLAADRYGRRITLMVDVLLYSLFDFLTGFSTGLTMFLVLRALYGIAMGGEWGVGASLVMETVPEESRGICRRVIPPAICSPRCCSSCSFLSSDGAACSSSAWLRRCSCSISAAMCRRARPS
jgi:SHS family lactate transporter-like MFS transporter